MLIRIFGRSGAYTTGETPGSIPNPAVKPRGPMILGSCDLGK